MIASPALGGEELAALSLPSEHAPPGPSNGFRLFRLGLEFISRPLTQYPVISNRQAGYSPFTRWRAGARAPVTRNASRSMAPTKASTPSVVLIGLLAMASGRSSRNSLSFGRLERHLGLPRDPCRPLCGGIGSGAMLVSLLRRKREDDTGAATAEAAAPKVGALECISCSD